MATRSALPTPIADVVDEATGRTRRSNAGLAPAGGPAGNARLTAWLGLMLLVLSLGEIVTALDVEGLLSWHVALGALLLPIAVSKTCTTSWRIVRYYGHSEPYRQAGPPPLLLRLLGPLVVLSTLGLLVSGVVLILVGSDSGRRPFLTVLGVGLDVLTLYQGLFIVFCVAAGLHVLARTGPAVRLVTERVENRSNGHAGMPGRAQRAGVLAATVAAGALLAVLLVRDESSWQHDRHGFDRPRGASVVVR